MPETTQIAVKLVVEGLHYFANCDIAPVMYLKNVHRHQFHLLCVKKVFHDDRDVEFIDFQHKIKKYLKQEYYSPKCECLMFGGMSCEQIAKDLLTQFDLDECHCFEDGENGAIVKTDNNHVNSEQHVIDEFNKLVEMLNIGQDDDKQDTNSQYVEWAEAYVDRTDDTFL